MTQMNAQAPARHHAGHRIEFKMDRQYPELSGWYIVYFDTEGESYEGLGPYDTRDLAQHIANLIEED